MESQTLSSAREARAGRCFDCDYSLRGLSRKQCPECGRRFDPSDPATMNFGRRIGRLRRYLGRPVGRPLLSIAIITSAIIFWQAGFLLHPARPSLLAVRTLMHLRMPVGQWHDQIEGLIFPVAFGLWAVVVLIWIVRLSVRLSLPLGFFLTRARRWWNRENAALILATVLVVTCNAIGWPLLVAEQWVAQVPRGRIASGPIVALSLSELEESMPVALREDDQFLVCEAAVRWLPDPRQRTAGLKLLMDSSAFRDELHPDFSQQGDVWVPELLAGAIPRESDPGLRATELRILSLYRRPWCISLFTGYLSDNEAEVGAAAADGLGIICAPAWPTITRNAPPVIDTAPPIDLIGLSEVWPLNGGNTEEQFGSAQTDTALGQMMVSGATAPEREAAARATLLRPLKDYRLRVAEWGVLVASNGGFTLPQSLIDDIPSFVHHTGPPTTRPFATRTFPGWVVTKPVIELTVNHPMSVDLQVVIRDGRPWFAYPRPTDVLQAYASAPTSLPAASLPRFRSSIGELYSGYPWLIPGTGPPSGAMPFPMFGPPSLADIGLRWQSIIASPTRLPWMKVAPVPPDERGHAYHWWQRLREVRCSWLCSRDESDRFLYYDGPTLAPCPVMATLKGRILHLTTKPLPAEWYPSSSRLYVAPPPASGNEFDGRSQRAPRPYTSRQAMLVRVAKGKVQAREIPVPDVAQQPLSADIDVNDASAWVRDAPGMLRELLISAGLTSPEADGMIDCWMPQFFQTDGTRLLLLLAPAEYDALCPIQIRPAPTELVRVGVVLTEF